MNRNINFLIKKIKNNKDFKSEYWVNATSNKNYLDIYNNLNSGDFRKRTFIRIFFYFIINIFIFNYKIFLTREYRTYTKICKKMQKIIDFDVMRHIFTLNILNKYNLINNKICIIGDGKTNCLSGIIQQNTYNKIYSINLPEVIIQEYLILTKFNIISKNLIKIVKSSKDLNCKKSKIFFVTADNFLLLKKKKINLFINISTFQEINKNIIKLYFDIIKSNLAYLYCCNRKKKHIGYKEYSNFNSYPIKDGKIIFYEQCPWYKKYIKIYNLKYLKLNDIFIKFKPILHCLVKF